MPEWLVAVVLGFIEGLTEFIPVSSTGHLLIAQHWLPRQSDLYNIVVQCGAVVAVLPLFKERLQMLSRWREPQSRELLAKIGVCFLITAGGGLALDKGGYKLTENVASVAWALIIVGALFIAVEQWLKNRPTSERITWLAVVLVAVAQLLAAVFPGTSRSGSTILFALALGTTRVVSTEFSFLVGIPTLLAAGALKIFRAYGSGVHENWVMLALATVIAAVVSFVAVRWLLGFVQHHTFSGFGVYRIVLGVVLLVFFLE
ncbi:MAG: undecaprenyl-diphosphate phosphatase [Verrucomicrobiota bacterium]|nr:undecaprenyl-diphosphate phosphatase [Verrucomicrobiota bacterium]